MFDPAISSEYKDIDYFLLSRSEIDDRVKQLANQISIDSKDQELVVISILKGAAVFTSDLIRYLDIPVMLDFVGVSSYRSGTESGELVFTKEVHLNIKDKNVLLIDDILDTGNTLTKIITELRLLEPFNIKTCVLLDKPSRRIKSIKADYVAFEIANHFVVGYGLDYAEKYRGLPHIGVLQSRIYNNDL